MPKSPSTNLCRSPHRLCSRNQHQAKQQHRTGKQQNRRRLMPGAGRLRGRLRAEATADAGFFPRDAPPFFDAADDRFLGAILTPLLFM